MKTYTRQTTNRLLNEEDITAWFRYHDSVPSILSEVGVATYP